MSWSVLFLTCTGILNGNIFGKEMKQLSVKIPPGKYETDGCSSNANCSWPADFMLTKPSMITFWPTGIVGLWL